MTFSSTLITISAKVKSSEGNMKQSREQVFLKTIARQYGITEKKEKMFLLRFDKENEHKENMTLLKSIVEEEKKVLHIQQSITYHVETICQKFYDNQDCPISSQTINPGSQKRKKARPPKGQEAWRDIFNWLWNEKYPQWQSENEINLPSIDINIGENRQLKLEEWQDVCLRMLESHKQLSSNSLLKAQFNRNLVEEELFIDLALVKLKPHHHEAHKQDIAPERGSEFYDRQEVEKRFTYGEFLQEVLSQGKQKNLVISGEPGAGKTTLLQKLAFWLLEETDDLVIWISLGNLGNKRLGDYLQEIWLEDAFINPTEEIKADWEQKFKEGRVWLLLDGLDEMNDTARDALSLQGWVTQSQLIISCRLNLWQGNPSQLQGFQTYLTQPFQDEQMQQFNQRWFRSLSGEKPEMKLGESLWEALQTPGKERIKDLCRNPLRLTLLSSIWQEGSLPDTTAELYQSFVDYMYDWKKKEFPMTKTEIDSLNAGLGKLAKASLDGEGTRFRLTHQFICQYLGNRNENSLLDQALRLGWLNEVGVAAENLREPVYAFYHATFQEYFAALAVDDWDYFLPKDHDDFPIDGKEYRIFQPQWKHVILLWVGRENIENKEKERLIQALVNFDDGCRDFYEYQPYFIAAAAINEFKNCSLASQIVKQVIKWAFGDFNIEKREWRTYFYRIEAEAREIIPETIRQLAITELITKLSEILEHCPDNFSEAVEHLAEIALGNLEAIAALVRILATNNDTSFIRCRLQAAYSLKQIAPGNPEAITALVKLLKTNKNEFITCGLAADILGKIAPENLKVIAALVELLKTNENKVICQIAASSLGKIAPGNLDVITALVELLKNSDDEDIRWQAADSLGKIAPGNLEAIAALVRILATTNNKSTRQQAADSLEKIAPGNPEAIAALVELLKNSENELIRLQAADSLGKIAPGNLEAISTLVRILATTDNEFTRWQTAKILEEIDPGNQAVITALVRILATTDDEDIRWQAADSLGKIAPGNLEAIAALVEILKTSENVLTRLKAAGSLDKIVPGNPESLTALVKLLKTNENELTRRQAAEILGKMIEIFEKIARNPEALTAFLVKRPEALTTLVKYLSITDSENTRRLAAKIFEKIARNLEALTILVKHHPKVFTALVKHLSTTDSKNTRGLIDTLVKLLATTEDESTRSQVVSSLEKILTTPEQYAGVVSALKDCLSNEVYKSNFDRFDQCYKVVWDCAMKLPYPQFYQAWHHPTTIYHPETTEQIPVGNNSTVDNLDNQQIELSIKLQNLPIVCINADILATETREGEIAQILCRRIWKQAFPEQMYPRVATPADLCYSIDQCKLTFNLPKLNLLLTHCEHPTPEVIDFCYQLTDTLAIAWLTNEPLEAPLKGFPPHQANLLSAIQTWLEET